MEFGRKENGLVTPQTRFWRLQFGCLLAALAMILAIFLLEDRASGVAYLLAERYLTVPAMVFLGVSLCQELPRRNRWHLYAGAAMVFLFFLNQMLHQVLEAEAKQLQLQASRISKKTKQWVSSSEQFKKNLQQVGSIESWVASVDKDLNLITTIMKSIYAPPKFP